MTVRVRRATAEDVPAMAAAMARAFYDDPLMAWILPDGRNRLPRLTGLFATGYAKVDLVHHEVYTADGAMGAATWAPPGTWKLSTRQTLPALPGTLRWLRGGSLRFASALGTLARHHPAEPHWYLAGLGTDPPFQRQGVGAALLAPVLERCDTEGVPAYLETQKERNVPYYGHHGFEVCGEVDVPGDGPHLWLMWRAPQSR